MGLIEKKRSKRSEWDEKPVIDVDPENEAPDDSDNSDSDESVDERAGTEHYVTVGKSKLREKEGVTLGPEYRGARVSRAALDENSDSQHEDKEGGSDEEEFADPDTADLAADRVDFDDEDEISSDDALCESDNEKLKGFSFVASKTSKGPKSRIAKRPTAADFMSESGNEDDGEELDGEHDGEDDSEDDSDLGSLNGAMLSDEEDDEDEDDEDDEVDEDGEGDEDEEMDDEEEEQGDDDAEDEEADNGDDQRAELRKIISEGQKSIVAAMSQAAKADADKGVAVRVQRRAFDSILNLRIRLQKALVAVNSFNVVESNDDPGMEPYQAAEEAAVKLWNTIDSVRHSLRPESKAKPGKKRKRDIDLDIRTEEIWERMETIEDAAMSHRRKVLDKWAARVRSGNSAVSTRRLGESASQSLVSVLDDQLLSVGRLVKRARTPRSCAPAQSAKKVAEDKDIYDDADFYQLLLKELVDQRSADTGAPGEFVATVRWAALKEAKTRKLVDRKASKGRKLRFTVHEKLQNFMAPEDRRTWEDHAVDRFFGTLFGQKMELKEDEASDEEMGGASVEEDGLRLFRG
ncbi:apoptosis-antagonizing transcription factor [Podospora didyma]|uniref:Protein BFR2 n=1 Tax=Podospora didyma TaxID=330526 RepID=A0AAE0TVY5_9PEZI|nr:apoptosis-antagonizing transcription factor [Podospora didyma]